MDVRRFRQHCRALREECPTAMGFPVRVRRIDRPNPPGCDLAAWTALGEDGRSFVIVLRRRWRPKGGRLRTVSDWEMLTDLMHEWAHAMAWTPDHPSLTDHGPHWGIAYSRAYGAIVED